MSFHFSRFLAVGALLSGFWFPTASTLAQQQPSGMTTAGAEVLPGTSELTAITRRSDLEIHLTGPEGKPIGADAKVTLVSTSGQMYRVGTAKAGRVKFEDVPATKWQVLVVAPGFVQELVQVDAGAKNATSASIQLRAISAEDASFSAGLAALPARAQTELGKVLAAMHANKPAEARSHLEAANKAAPNRPEVNYLFGLYFSQAKDFTQANSFWTKTLEANPKHFLALLSMGEAFLHENKAAEALPYLERAVEAEPTSWRAYALLANAEMHEGSTNEAIQNAERALELGHGQAEKVQPFLAGALAKHGEKERAIALLRSYLKDHPADAAAQKQLEKMQTASVVHGAMRSEETSEETATMEANSLPEVSNWLPPDIDEKVPAVEAGATCQIDEVLREAGKRMEEFVGNVERFTATEFVTHESINKWGMASSPEQRRFEYLVSVHEVIPGFLKVDEYRSNSNNSPVEFPGGVETNGLPALVLIFHPL
jgi:tetratricopeptide (TPR) repeat protein